MSRLRTVDLRPNRLPQGVAGSTPSSVGSRLTPNRRSSFGEGDDVAKHIRETFMDRPATRVDTLKWKWPKALRHVGVCEAVLYVSDKWHPGKTESYKHVAEGPQDLFVRDGFVEAYDGDLELHGELADCDGWPDSFAVLAEALGIQATLFERDDEGLYLPERDGAWQIDLSDCKLGAGVHDSGRKFLIIYDDRGVCALVTGEILDVEADGITG